MPTDVAHQPSSLHGQLSAQSWPLIEATLPIIGEHIETIAERFYTRMFTQHPELLDGLFNRGNQRSGEQKKALAGSIVGYARSLLEGTDDNGPLMTIAHKHASLGIAPHQYSIVHEHLFAAIADVLGGALTPEIAAAWEEVYWLMAENLMGREKALYARQANKSTWMPWRLIDKKPAGVSAMMFTFEPADNTPVTPGRAGQYVSVRFPMDDGIRQARQYSLSADAESAARRTITVKRDEKGEVSQALHGRIQVGDVVELSNPYGEIELSETNAPLAFFSAGIGCTPVAAMLRSLAARADARDILVVHAERSWDQWALGEQMLADAEALPHAEFSLWLEDGWAGPSYTQPVHSGRVQLDEIVVRPEARVYLCGPLPFMRMVRQGLLEKGIPAANIHYEVFGPDLWHVS